MPEPDPVADLRPTLLLVDDDPLIVDSLSFVLQKDFDLQLADSRAAARASLLQQVQVPVIALVDLGLPPHPHTPDEGFSLIADLLAFNPNMKILVLSGQNEMANIQHALTLGAVDFIPKPTDVELLVARLKHQLLILAAEDRAVAARSGDCGLVGSHQVLETLRAQIRQFAALPFAVLVQGESGTGKELVAQCMHHLNPRVSGSCLTVNCAAIARDLLEAQLFGHAKGAFTGATSAHAGFFEEAAGGTLILDEIGEFPMELQPKLLRVLENGEFYRVGETRARQTDARIVVSTNRDLAESVRSGAFREDLYHRLSVLSVRVPPLRERGEDILSLYEHFVVLYTQSGSRIALDAAARERLLGYPFPGNVRELRNIVIRLIAKHAGATVSLNDLEQELELTSSGFGSNAADDEQVGAQLDSGSFDLNATMAVWEKRYIDAALARADGNLSRAARLLGVNRTTLYSRIERLRGH